MRRWWLSYMSAEIGKVVDQVFRLVFIVRNIAQYRSLEPFKDEFEQNYWILILNNFLDIATLEWCKVFGSRSEATHWSSLVEDIEGFRNGMLEKLGVSQAEWDAYWENIKNYRDQVVAHHQRTSDVSHYPDFGHALVSCFYYYEILIKQLRAFRVYDYPDNLEEYFQKYLTQAEHFSDIAYRATKGLKEQVN
jgi:hypothetical protein